MRDVTPIAAPRTENGSNLTIARGQTAFRVAIATLESINRGDRTLVMLALISLIKWAIYNG
jgi:hypothetical protein